jgi:hypothetical protein
MSNSSQPKNSLDTLILNGKTIDEYIKDITIDLGGTGVSASDITVNSAYNYQYDYNISPITMIGAAGSTVDTITITGSDGSSNFTWALPQEWQDSFPEWHRVQDMCDQYPGLKVAFDNFKVFYEMIKDDYDNPTPKK